MRAIRRSTSQDFLSWTEPVNMQANAPGEHLYTSVTQPYFRAPHIYIALPTRFQTSAGSITDIVLMATRPGSDRYHRHFKEAFIRPGLGDRGWGNRANYITLNVVQTSPTHMSMFMYGGGHYTMRLDGFISVHADTKKASSLQSRSDFLAANWRSITRPPAPDECASSFRTRQGNRSRDSVSMIPM